MVQNGGTAVTVEHIINGSEISLTHPADGNGEQGRRPGNSRNRPRRWVRRTDSGHSVRTLPEYSLEAGDQELVLVR